MYLYFLGRHDEGLRWAFILGGVENLSPRPLNQLNPQTLQTTVNELQSLVEAEQAQAECILDLASTLWKATETALFTRIIPRDPNIP